MGLSNYHLRTGTLVLIVLLCPQTHAGAIDGARESERALERSAHLPGERLVFGTVIDLRSEQIVIDIGELQPLYVPLKPTRQKDLEFNKGDAVVVTMNDHNAVVDYYKPGQFHTHQILYGQLTQPLTIGYEKAMIRTVDGDVSYPIASRAGAKLAAMPIGVDLMFLADESGQLIDAQLASREAVRQSSMNNKAGKIMGAHKHVRAVYKSSQREGKEITVLVQPENQERRFHYKPPLDILDQLIKDQEIVLLMDHEDYVVDVATADPPPRQYRPDK